MLLHTEKGSRERGKGREGGGGRNTIINARPDTLQVITKCFLYTYETRHFFPCFHLT